MTGTRSLVYRILAVAVASLALAVLPGGSADAQGVSPIVIQAAGQLEAMPCPTTTCTGTLDGEVVETFHFAGASGPATVNIAWLLADLQSTFEYDAGTCPVGPITGSGTALLSGGTAEGVVTLGTIPHFVTSVEADYFFEFTTAGPLVLIQGMGGGQISIWHTGGFIAAHFGPSAGVGVLTVSTLPACDGSPVSFTMAGAIAAIV